MRTRSKLAPVHVNGVRVGDAHWGDWDDAMRVVGDYAIIRFRDELGEVNNYTALRATAFDAYAKHLGVEQFPMLTFDNAEETAAGMEIYVGLDSSS